MPCLGSERGVWGNLHATGESSGGDVLLRLCHERGARTPDQGIAGRKKAGRKIVGSYCVFVPGEIVLAANATLVGPCSGADFAMDEVEKLLPRNTCALIKSAFGFNWARYARIWRALT